MGRGQCGLWYAKNSCSFVCVVLGIKTGQADGVVMVLCSLDYPKKALIMVSGLV